MIGDLAFIFAAAYFGAALHTNLAEHPARLGLPDVQLLQHWQHASKRGLVLLHVFSAASALCGLIAFFGEGGWPWLVGALLVALSYPFTMFVVKPTNKALTGMDPKAPGPNARSMLGQWGWLHAGRTLLGLLAVLAYLVARN